MRAFLAAQPALSPTDFASTDDAADRRLDARHRDARVEITPAQVVGGSVLSTAQPDLDDLMTELFGTTAPRGRRSATATGARRRRPVGAQLIPAGFRIVLSDNADTFDYKTTEVIADGTDNETEAAAPSTRSGSGRSRCPRYHRDWPTSP